MRRLRNRIHRRKRLIASIVAGILALILILSIFGMVGPVLL